MGSYKKYLTIFLIFSVYMIPFHANAASLGGWTTGNSIVQGASVILNASKEVILNGASKIANGTAKITPTAAQVSKALAGGAAAVALDLAIQELLGGVDYVLDPANNSINYTKPASTDCGSDGSSCTSSSFYYGNPGSSLKFTTVAAFCSYAATITSSEVVKSGEVYCTLKQDGATFNYSVYKLANPVYDPNAESDNQPKSLPLSTISNQVISMAEGGNSTAQQAIKAAADTIVAEAETDSTKARPIVNQFEQTSTIETSETATSTSETTSTANPDDTATTETQTSFPVFCNWAPTLCQAANVVIQKPSEWAESIKAAYDDAVDYFKSEPDNSDSELDIDQTTEIEPNTTISFSTACPAKIPLTFNWNGQTLDFSFDFTIWCEAISTYVYPIVVSLGSLHALYIVAGVRQDG